LYSSSVTFSIHLTIPFWVLVLIEIWVNSLSREEACQFFTSGRIWMVSPL
jgi:hypothetical protein